MSTAASSSTEANQGTSGQRQGNAAAPSLVDRLRSNPRVPLIIAAAASVAIIVALLMWARAPEYRVLYSTLTDADGGKIVSELDSVQVIAH